jgi:hypothetical protein
MYPDLWLDYKFATHPPEEYFHWVGVQFTADGNNQTVRAVWPPGNPARDMKDQHSRRRMSIAPKDIQDTINAIALAQQAQLAQQQAEFARKQAQQLKAQTCKVIAEKLKSNFWTIPGNQGAVNRGLSDLADGKEIGVTTKRGGSLRVKFEGGVLKQA